MISWWSLTRSWCQSRTWKRNCDLGELVLRRSTKSLTISQLGKILVFFLTNGMAVRIPHSFILLLHGIQIDGRVVTRSIFWRLHIVTGRDCVRPFPITVYILQKCTIPIENHHYNPLYVFIEFYRSISSPRKSKIPLLSSSLCSSVQSICLCQVGHRCHRRLEGDAAGFCVIISVWSWCHIAPNLHSSRYTTIQLPGRRFRQFHGPTCLYTANACRRLKGILLICRPILAVI